MVRTTTAATTEPNTPAFQAWHVTKNGDKGFWTKVGAAWPHRDGKGLSLQLDVLPMDGHIVLRQPLPKTDDQGARLARLSLAVISSTNLRFGCERSLQNHQSAKNIFRHVAPNQATQSRLHIGSFFIQIEM